MKPIQGQQPQIRIEQTTGIICEACEGNLFAEGLFLRAASRFITNTPVDAIMPIPAFYCVKCFHVNDQFNPTKQALAQE